MVDGLKTGMLARYSHLPYTYPTLIETLKFLLWFIVLYCC